MATYFKNECDKPLKKKMIFVSTGTQFPFDRLIEMVDSIAGDLGEEVVAQAMPGKYAPRHFKLQALIPARQFEEYVAKSRLIVAHAGMGIIITAMRLGKPLLVLPRMARLGEHRNDHQLSTASHLQQMGYVTVVNDEAELRRYLSDTSAIAGHALTDTEAPGISAYIAEEIEKAAAAKK